MAEEKATGQKTQAELTKAQQDAQAAVKTSEATGAQAPKSATADPGSNLALNPTADQPPNNLPDERDKAEVAPQDTTYRQAPLADQQQDTTASYDREAALRGFPSDIAVLPQGAGPANQTDDGKASAQGGPVRMASGQYGQAFGTVVIGGGPQQGAARNGAGATTK